MPRPERRPFQRRATGAAEAELRSRFGDVLARIYASRGVESAEALDLPMEALLDPSGLAGIEAAVSLLEQALARDARILFVGDFDADGATSVALGICALRAMGASRVDYVVPNRFEFGYGLTPEIVAFAESRDPELLITVDNGISSVEGVAAAKGKGWQVLITDHHLQGAELPAADAIVNPNLVGCTFASKALAGVGVIFYVMAALRARLRAAGWFSNRGIQEPNLAELLDLVALGTVADLVPLDRNNRILVRHGLNRVRRGLARPGIAALCGVSGRKPERLSAADLGYALGPRLNAAGRLEDMSVGIDCLLDTDIDSAFARAEQLDRLNRARREIEANMTEEALAILERIEPQEGMPCGLCLFDEGFHQGIVGILASRLRERFHRPVFVCAPAGDDASRRAELRGSGRSVSGFHLRDALAAIAVRNPGLIERFGGHAMAAGLTLSRWQFPRFAEAFDEEVRRQLSEAELTGVIETDGELAPAELSLDMARRIENAGPWGQGFPEPLFEGRFDVVTTRQVGERHTRLVLSAGDRMVDAVAFDTRVEPGIARIAAAYRLGIDSHEDVDTLQLVIEHLEVLAP
jgi:single-stranded-DNA-specific exonuclease